MNYQPVTAGNQSNPSAGSKNPYNTDDVATFEVKEPEFEGKKPESEVHVSPSSSAKTKKHDDKTTKEAKGKSPIEFTPIPAVGQISTNSTNTFSATGPSNTAVSLTLKKSSYVDPSQYPDDLNMPALENINYSDDEEEVDVEADFTNLETTITVSPIPTTKVHKDHPMTQIIGDLSSTTQTRSMTRMVKDQGGLTQINNKDFHTCMFACFLSQEEPKRVHQALKDSSGIKAMQEEIFQFRMQKEEGIDYEEVFPPVARIEAIRLFLAYASFMGFMVYQMDLKSTFLFGTIKEEVYVCQPLGFEDPDYPDKVSVDDIIFGSTNKDLCKAFEKLMKDKFQMSSMGEPTFFLGLQVKQKPDGIFISQNKYLAKILRKFGLTDGKSASTPIDIEKPLLKDPDGEDVDVYTYISMIGSLMYLTLSRPDIIYLKGKPHLGLWYPKDLPFNLVAYSDSDYAGASLDRKFTTGGCRFLGCRLISWQCKKKTVGATSSTKAEYVAAATCCVQVLWIQSQFLDYGSRKSINCLPHEEIFIELARMEYEKPSTKLTFYKAFFSAQWMFLIHTILQCISAKRTTWNEFSSSMASAVICLASVADSVPADDVADNVLASIAKPTPPSPPPTTTSPLPPQELPSTSHVTPTPPPSPVAQPSPPPQQQQPSQPTTISMDLLNSLLETYTALTRRVEHLEQDKIAQALEIIKLKKWVKKLEKKRKLIVTGLKRLRKVGTTQRIESSADTVMDDQEDASKQGEIIANIDANEDVTLKDVVAVAKDIDVEKNAEVKKNANVQGRLEESQDKVYHIDLEHADKVLSTAAATTITVAAPTITDALSAARKRKGVVIRDPEEQVKENGKQDNVVLRYQSLKRKPQTEAQARKNMIVYLKNMAGFKMDYFKGMSYDAIFLIFKKYFNSNVAFLEKSKEELEEEESRALKRKTESSKEKAVKKQKLDEVVEELKKHLQIVPKDDYEDVYTEATPLALKMILLVEKRYLLTSFKGDVAEDFKQYTLRDYYCWLKTYNCWCKLMLLDDAADIKLRLLEQSAAVVQLVSVVQIVNTVSIRVTIVMYKLILLVSAA
uniref:Reverse transcriptase Ty1/copia-type domain-containing protein n=1 Tax=Tanacetum cinerariifolium TaxID=118510 RepID=A0A6L2KMV5_TANCI|nr:hypothetical protein [Tanacetum cinerariifolium]